MSRRHWSSAAVVVAIAAAACSNNNGRVTGPAVTLGNPDSLTFLLLPGAPDQPNGVLLSWVPATDPNVTNYVVYARGADTGTFGVVGTTISNSFHDAGVPPFHQYYVASEDQFGDISRGTASVTIDTAPPLPPPRTIEAMGIDSGSKLHWSTDARLVNPALFSHYRVYSETAVVSGSTASCPTVGPDFAEEGTTVSEDFVVTGLTNGVAWCYGVTTVTLDGHESVLSGWAMDTTNASGGKFYVASAPRTTVVVHQYRHGGTRARGK
jgi:hypothetical protein